MRANEEKELAFLFSYVQGEGDITPLKGGTSNRIYATSKHIIRYKTPYPVDALDTPEKERRAIAKGSNCPLLPKVAYFSEDGHKVERRLMGAVKEKFSSVDIQSVAESIRRLHKCPLIGIEFDLAKRISFYHAQAGDIPEIEGEMSRLYQIKAIKEIESYPRVYSHNDLWAGNILFDEGKAYFLDLEFAADAPDILDYLSFVEENDIDLRFDFGPANKEKTLALSYCLDILWAYWAKARYLQGCEAGKGIMESKVARFAKGKEAIERYLRR